MEKPRIATMILACVLLFCEPGREGHGQTPTPGPITKSVIVLSLRSASQAQRCSNATLAAEIFTDANSVRAYYAENSYGLASISGTVSGPYTIAMGDTCDTDKYESAADAGAFADRRRRGRILGIRFQVSGFRGPRVSCHFLNRF